MTGACAPSAAPSGKPTPCSTRVVGTTKPCLRARRTIRPAREATAAASPISARHRGRPSRTPAYTRPPRPSIKTRCVKPSRLLFFASIDYDLIPKVLTITAGTRHFRFDNTLRAASPPAFRLLRTACRRAAVVDENYNLNAANLPDTESGFKSRANLTWHVTPDTMLYYTFSQGFRPGGFNQNGGLRSCLHPRAGIAVHNSQKSYLI